jgi:hypothetical protein
MCSIMWWPPVLSSMLMHTFAQSVQSDFLCNCAVYCCEHESKPVLQCLLIIYEYTILVVRMCVFVCEQVSSSLALIPDSDMPMRWLPAYVAETDFKIMIVSGVLEVDVVKRRDQFLIEVLWTYFDIRRPPGSNHVLYHTFTDPNIASQETVASKQD